MQADSSAKKQLVSSPIHILTVSDITFNLYGLFYSLWKPTCSTHGLLCRLPIEMWRTFAVGHHRRRRTATSARSGSPPRRDRASRSSSRPPVGESNGAEISCTPGTTENLAER